MVTICCATDLLVGTCTFCCTCCFADSCLSVTVPCITCGKYIAMAGITISPVTSAHDTCVRFVDGCTNLVAHTHNAQVAQFHSLFLTASGCANGQTLKIQAKPASNTSTFSGTGPACSYINLLATDGAAPVCTSTQKKVATALTSVTSCTFTNVVGATLCLPSRCCGFVFAGGYAHNQRTSGVAGNHAININLDGRGIRAHSAGANFAMNPGVTALGTLAGANIDLRLRDIGATTAQHTFSCPQGSGLFTFEISP